MLNNHIEFRIKMQQNSFKKLYLKMFVKKGYNLFCPGLHVLNQFHSPELV